MQANSSRVVTRIEANPLLSRTSTEFVKKKVAAYCRVSTDSEDQLNSYEAQIAYYTEAIAKNPNWTFAGIYADEGITGTATTKRKDFLRLMRDCEKGKVDFILTKSVSRFARNTVDSLMWTRKLRAKGIGVYFEEQAIDSLKAENEMLIGLFSVIAQSESENISANVKWGVQQRMRSGTYMTNFNCYELISGHRRKFACAKLGIDTLPVIVRDLSREEAIIFMVDSNLQREHILPSERAKAYKMKMEAIKQQGRRTDLTSGPMVPKLSREQLGESNGECGRQISRYIRLNNLIPELLEDVDMGKIAFRPAVELSYLDVEEQKDLSYYIDEGEATPSLAQAIQMKKLSQAGVLTEERIEAILSEEKPNQKPKIKVPMERIQKYFSPDASVQEIEDTIVKALSAYRRSQELQMAKANRTIKEAR